MLILVLNVIPAYETMFNSFRPSWTAIGRDDLEVRTGTFITIKEDVVFGVNVHSYDVHFKERWHRLRLGFPLKLITIDFEERKKQVQGRIETNWLFVNIGASLVLWMLLELILSATRRSKRG
jgi:hypothetical protein